MEIVGKATLSKSHLFARMAHWTPSGTDAEVEAQDQDVAPYANQYEEDSEDDDQKRIEAKDPLWEFKLVKKVLPFERYEI